MELTPDQETQWSSILKISGEIERADAEEQFLILVAKQPKSDFDTLLALKDAETAAQRTIIIHDKIFDREAIPASGKRVYYRCHFEECWAEDAVDDECSFIHCVLNGGPLSMDCYRAMEATQQYIGRQRLFNAIDPFHFSLMAGIQ